LPRRLAMSAGQAVDCTPDSLELRTKPPDLRQIRLADPFELACTGTREPKTNDSLVDRILPTLDESRGLGTVHQSDRAVVPDQQTVCNVTNRGAAFAAMTSDGEQQLMLSGREPDLHRLILAVLQELPDRGAKFEQT